MGSLARKKLGEIEMYLYLLLLISPNFGMPSSPLIDIGAGFFPKSNLRESRQLAFPSSTVINARGVNINLFDALPNFTESSQAILEDRRLFHFVAGSLEEAETNIIALTEELRLYKIEDINIQDNYFPEYNKAKQHLRESRQKLWELADRTVREVRVLKVLLEALDDSKDVGLLEVTLDQMKNLMIETLKILKEALGKYNEAQRIFTNLNSSVKTQEKNLKNVLEAVTDEYDEKQERHDSISKKCAIADWFTFGLCSPIHEAVNSGKLERVTEMLEKMESITSRWKKSGDKLDEFVKDAIGILTKEIELINGWKNDAEIIKREIHDRTIKNLKKYTAIRDNFITGLDNLENSAQNFLDHPVEIF